MLMLLFSVALNKKSKEREYEKSRCEGFRLSYIHECSVDVVAAFSIDGDEEGQAAVRRQHIHAAVLLMVPWQ